MNIIELKSKKDELEKFVTENGCYTTISYDDLIDCVIDDKFDNLKLSSIVKTALQRVWNGKVPQEHRDNFNIFFNLT